MNENPYQPPVETDSIDDVDVHMQWAGIGPRLGAYLIDVLPITLAIAFVYYFFLGSKIDANVGTVGHRIP